MSSRRPGLMFELAPAPAVHPLRTDIAMMVGTVARRRVVRPSTAMPVVLARWLQAQGVERVGGVPVARLAVALDSVQRFIDGLVRQADDAEATGLRDLMQAALLATDSVDDAADLVDACRELTPPPGSLIDDLLRRGFRPAAADLAGWLRLQRLHNLPVVVDSFDAFDALFAWERRGIRDRIVREGDPVVSTPLGVAMRAFFGEGGRRAHVVRSGDPSDVFDSASERFHACFPEAPEADRCTQLPGVRGSFRRGLLVGLQGDVALPALDGWVGLEHVYGLPEVSFALLPDLIDACAESLAAQLPPAEVVAVPEVFVECADSPPPASRSAGRRLPPPRLNPLGLETWRMLVQGALTLLAPPGRAFHRRDVQLLASLPLVGEGRELPTPDGWLAWMAATTGWMSRDGESGLSSPRLQLAWPWPRTADSADAQGGVEAPEGMLAGVLARSALERGSFRSAATQPLRRFQGHEPDLAWTQALRQSLWTPLGELGLPERLCLLGPSPQGPQLLSDASASADPATRQAAVRRLVNVVIQAARRAGDDFTFEPAGEALWRRVRERLSDLLRSLLAAGALSSDGGAFDVQCGRDTMTQSDIDAGRLIARVAIRPAQPIRRIVVMLNLRDAGSAPALASALAEAA